MDEKQEQILKQVEIENRETISLKQEELSQLNKINGDQLNILQELQKKQQEQQKKFNSVVEENHKHTQRILELQESIQNIRV